MQTKDFAVFLELWNMTQGYITPSIHHRMATWLQTSWETGDKRLLLMAFRASGKSTLVGLFSAWLLCRDPDLRILVLAAESSLASKMVRNIKRTIEKHPLTKHLIPNNPDQWASDRFTIKRNLELRDPSVLAAGVTANITGNRADVIIYDDVEVPNTCGTQEKRENLRERLSESNFILVPNGTQLYVGTPHSYFSIYADKPREEIGEKNTYLSNYKRYEQPLLTKKNESVWPEQFSNKNIDILRRQSGPNKFASQMMLKPKNILEGRLDISLLQYYKEDIDYREANGQIQLSLNDRKLVSCSAWWDPAFGSAKGDHSVLAIIFTDEGGLYYLHHLSYIKIDESEGEAYSQCKIVANIIKEICVPSVTIETNGIGKFLPAILKQELGKQNISCSVIDFSNYKPKHIRILESFDAVLAAGALFIHEDVKKTPFLTEMMEWQPERNRGHDDGLDAVAGALSLEPVRIKRIYPNKNIKWRSGMSSYHAHSEFDV